MFCLGPSIPVSLTKYKPKHCCRSIVVVAFPNCCGSSFTTGQCTTKNIQEWLEEHNEELAVWGCLPNSPALSPIYLDVVADLGSVGRELGPWSVVGLQQCPISAAEHWVVKGRSVLFSSPVARFNVLPDIQYVGVFNGQNVRRRVFPILDYFLTWLIYWLVFYSCKYCNYVAENEILKWLQYVSEREMFSVCVWCIRCDEGRTSS